MKLSSIIILIYLSFSYFKINCEKPEIVSLALDEAQIDFLKLTIRWSTKSVQKLDRYLVTYNETIYNPTKSSKQIFSDSGIKRGILFSSKKVFVLIKGLINTDDYSNIVHYQAYDASSESDCAIRCYNSSNIDFDCNIYKFTHSTKTCHMLQTLEMYVKM